MASLPRPATANEPRSVTILGSTGSVGCSTIDLIARNRDAFVVDSLTANSRVEQLAAQARDLKARRAVIADPDLYGALKEALAGSEIEVAAGPEAVVEAAQRPTDWVMSAIVGAAGLEGTLAAVRRGAIVGLANKETLVCAGELMIAEVQRHGSTLLPVDSEHNAIYQVMDFERRESIDRIILTCSGGPFRSWTREQMAAATPAQAVAHPNWDMGAKISVDSATLMNKGLELIEAYHLFAMPESQIEIIVHPQSVIHSMVGYIDGSVLAQMGDPDMRTPIAYSLAWPERMPAPVQPLDFAAIATLTFEAPDSERFPALRLARESLRLGGTAPTVLNAANEIAVAHFLKGELPFLEIAGTVERTLEAIAVEPLDSLDRVRETDAEARRVARALVARLPQS